MWTAEGDRAVGNGVCWIGSRRTPRRTDAFGYLMCKDCIEDGSDGYSAVDVSKGLMIMVIAGGIERNCVDIEVEM